MYAFGRNIRTVCTALFNETEHKCPNCHSKFTVDSPQVQGTGKWGEGYSLLRGEEYKDEDEDAVAYVDATTPIDQASVQSAADVYTGKGKGVIKLQDSRGDLIAGVASDSKSAAVLWTPPPKI
jgi:hypothetical protein